MKSRNIIAIALAMIILPIFSSCNSGKKQEDFDFTRKTTEENVTVTATKKQEVQITTYFSEEIREDEEDNTGKTYSIWTLPETIIPETSPPQETTTESKPDDSSEVSQPETTRQEEEQPNNYNEISDLPESIMENVKYWQEVYPNMSIGVGLYTLDGRLGYEYNADCLINSACTIKAAYAMFVLKECERQNIDIWETTITYQKKHADPGSGDINLYGYYGTEYSIGYLVYLMLDISDNVAYNMLLDKFPLNDFYLANTEIGGECDWQKWGKASVVQRKNEWVAIWNYINSGSLYSQVLREDLTGTKYAYFLEGMYNWHNYMQKSGWTEDSPDYPAAGEAAIIDDSYLLVVLTEDYSKNYNSGHFDVLQSIGGAVESYYYACNGYMF